MISSKVCWNCSSSLRSARSFANSARHLQQTLPPESPNFIEYPKPPQPDFQELPPVKGTLPVPRDVFRHRSKLPKNSPEFLSQTTPEPSTSSAKAGPRTLWKQRMAASRRKNLREGIVELSQRKVKTEKITTTKSLEKQHRNRELLLSPEAEDERLTRPTIDLALRNFLNGGAATPSEVADLVAERHKLHQQLQEAKAENRQDALHALYMHARTFITTEEELGKEIEREFPEENSDGVTASRNIWNVHASPQNVGYGLKKTTTREGQHRIAKERMKKIAESLTGGIIERS